ncbi:hypothetical protein TTHERM_00827170 (macronuclear) [Tetrahymena thermophila SB210]|uniref:Uncharacterized protein n=1 Tax=Tetrahymena thermophila (strain SB210) TaxID=312017 RepID=Q22EF2_TETTS|nr:hypothetical protein TTHERM_00827170 [Tetrahymena thermophila SB210]EAR83700.2 hypothetical protein TTHERM_00827170 [Tetrahymena thermophila SB210]|eukprot:XP_001031363.2 hypothetical protein TTHERM_00827170 [Tetrahymena thermophila SB210]
MENEIHALKEQLSQQQIQIKEFQTSLKKKEETLVNLTKQNERISQNQEKLQRQLDMFEELTTDQKGKKIQYSVKANLKNEIMQNLVEEICFQQSIAKLEQKMQEMNFNINQRISQIQTDLCNVEVFCNKNMAKVQETVEVVNDFEKNKNISKDFLQKYDSLMNLLQKNELIQGEVKNRCELLETQMVRKVDINDVGKLTEQIKDGFVSNKLFTTQLENVKQQLYNEIKRKTDQSQFDQHVYQIEAKLEYIKNTLRSQPKNQQPSTVVKVVQNSKQKVEKEEEQERVPQIVKQEIQMQQIIKEVPVINTEIVNGLEKKIEQLQVAMNKHAEDFSTQIIDYQSQIMNIKSNFDTKFKISQGLVQSAQTSASEAVKRGREVEQYVLDNMLTKDYISQFQKKINDKIDNFDKGYQETIEKLTQISNRATDSLGDLAIRLRLIPTREELIERLEFVQAVSTDNIQIKMDIQKILDLLKEHDEFFLLKANKIDLKRLEDEIEVIKKKEPDFIVMQCEKDVTQIKDEVKEFQKEIIDFRAEIIKMLNFSIFEEGELETYQEKQKQKVSYNNFSSNNRNSYSPNLSNNQTQKQINPQPLRTQLQAQQNRKTSIINQQQKNSKNNSKQSSERESALQLEEQETGRYIFPWVDQIRNGIFDTYSVYDVLYTKANHSQVQELFDKKANKMVVGKLMDIVNNMKKQLVYLVVGQNQLIKTISNTSEQAGQSQGTKEENRHKREIELQSLLRQNTKLLVWISSQDLGQDQQFVKKLKEKNAITVDFNMMEQMVEEVFSRYQQLHKLYVKQPNIKYTQEEIKLLDNFVRDIIPNRQLQFDDIYREDNQLEVEQIEFDQNDFVAETMQSQHIKSNKIFKEKYGMVLGTSQQQSQLLNENQNYGMTEPNQVLQKQLSKQISIIPTNNSDFTKSQQLEGSSFTFKNNKSKLRIDASDKKDKTNKSIHITQHTNQQEDEDNLFLQSIQKDTQLLKDSLNTLITKDGYTKIFISPEEAEQIKKDSKYLKSSSTFISKKASTVSTTRALKKTACTNQFATNDSQESIQYLDLLASQNQKVQEQRLLNNNVITQNIKKRDAYKKQKQKQNVSKLNQTQVTQGQYMLNNSNSDLNQTYSQNLTQQSIDLSTSISRRNKNQASFSLSNKKQFSHSENISPREDLFSKTNYKQKHKNSETSYDITDF